MRTGRTVGKSCSKKPKALSSASGNGLAGLVLLGNEGTEPKSGGAAKTQTEQEVKVPTEGGGLGGPH
eukprot:7245401-Karenia_brevis.AAC.1